MAFKWDNTLSLSALIAAVIIMVPIIGGAYVLRNQVATIETKVDASFGKVEERLQAMEDAIVQLRLENARRDGLAAEVAEIKNRLRTLENRR